MKDKKESRPGDCSTRTAEGTAAYGRAAVPKANSTTAAVRQIKKIADLLSRGQENAIPRRHLRQLTGLSDRDLRRRIQMERLSGVPILSDCENGYFLPDSPAEVKRFVQGMNLRADEIRAVAAAVEGAEL